MRLTSSREFFIPNERQGRTNIQTQTEGDVVVYTYECLPKNGRMQLAGMGFHGKQAKPDWHFTFGNEESRARHIARYLSDRAERARLIAERRGTPSDTAVRNRAIKAVCEQRFGKGNVSVTGSRGTAYGWVNVKIDYPTKDWHHARELSGEVMKLIRAAGIKLGTYYGDGDTAHSEIHIDFKSREEAE
jgi:hypothetical protein